MGKSKWWTWTRSWWTPQVVFCTVIVIILTAVIMWDYIPHEKVIPYTALAFFCLGLGYAIRHLPRAPITITLWRGLFILLGASFLSFILFIVFMILQKLGLVDFPGYWAIAMLLAYLIGVPIGWVLSVSKVCLETYGHTQIATQ